MLSDLKHFFESFVRLIDEKTWMRIEVECKVFLLFMFDKKKIVHFT